MSRTYPPRPILAVGGLVYRDDTILLAKRGKDPGRGMWSIPGGAVETGETLIQAVVRELCEEVNLKVEVGPLVEIIERIVLDAEGKVMYHYVIHDYVCLAPHGNPVAGSDADDALFVPRDQWEEYGVYKESILIMDKGHTMYRELPSSA